MTQLDAYIQGLAVWPPFLSNWDAAQQAFSELTSENKERQATRHAPIPMPDMLTPAERRRAPETVSLALEVARHAVTMWGGHPADLLSVFTSANGDTPIIDYMCNTLVSSPQLVSPTRFLHSIHNAPAGVWSIATANAQANTSLSAHHCSFSNGLLEALVQCHTEKKSALLVGYDTTAPSALAGGLEDLKPMAIALIISSQTASSTKGILRCTLQPQQEEQSAPHTISERKLMASGMAQALPLLEALASKKNAQVNLMLSAHQTLVVHCEPCINPTTDL